MRPFLLLILLGLGCTLESTVLQNPTDLQSPGKNETDQIKEIQKIATVRWLHGRGLMAEESVRVVGYFIAAREIPHFAQREDKVWEVRVLYLGTTPTGILWINEKTGSVISMGEQAKVNTEPVGRADAVR